MATIVLRAGKGSPLTNAEVDANFSNLNTAVVDAAVTASWASVSGKPATLAGYGITDAQALDADLTAIAALSGTNGFLKKTAANTWALDTATYLTSSGTAANVSGTVAIANGGTGATTAAAARTSLGLTSAATTALSVLGSAGILTNGGDGVVEVGRFLDFHAAGGDALDYVNRIESVSTGTMRINASVILHSGNFTTYAPALTGTGASGNWAINVTGAANSATYLTSSGTVSGDINTALNSGVFAWSNTATNTPLDGAFGTVFGFIGQGNSYTHDNSSNWLNQIGFITNGQAPYYRQKINNSAFTPWRQLLSSSNYNSYSPSLTGNGASGTWNISVTGNAATATTLQTARTLTLGNTGKTFNGSENVAWTLAEIGALPLTGGTLTGATTVSSGSPTKLVLETTALLAKGRLSIDANGVFSSKNTQWNGSAWVEDDSTKKKFLYAQHSSNNRHEFRTAPAGAGVSWVTALTIDETTVNSTVALQQNGNQVLHASNYNNYAPTLTGTNASGTWGINVTGNAATASNAVNATNAWQLGSTTASKANAFQYWQSFGDSALNPSTGWYYAFRMSHGDADTYYSATIALDFHSDSLLFRRKVNGVHQSWRTVLHDGNYNSYAPSLTGTGAYGTWGINVTGNAATASTLNSGAVISGTAYFRKNQTVGDYTTAPLWTESYGNTSTGIAFHISGVAGRYLEMRNNSSNLFWNGNAILNDSNYNSYSPTLTGTGASGTWGVNVTGSSASVSGLTLTSSANGINPDSVTQNQLGYITSVGLFGQTDGGLYSSAYDGTWIHQIFGDFRTGQLAVRGKNSGTWQSWRAVLDSSNYNSYAPTLTGTGASGTWGISVTGNAATAYGLNVHTARNNEANKVVRTDGTGYIQAGWINTTSGDNGTAAIDRIYASNDAYLRYYTPANFRTVLDVPTRGGTGASGTWGISVTGNAATATTASQLGGITSSRALLKRRGRIHPSDSTSLNSSITSPEMGFTYGGSGEPTGPFIAFGGLGGDIDYACQLVGSYSGGGNNFVIRTRNDDTVVWNPWRTLITDGNYSSYALPLTGGTVEGTANIRTSITKQYHYVRHIEGKNWDTYSTGGDSLYLNYVNNQPVYIGSGSNLVLHAGNYNSYAPSLGGSGAAGTWAINVTGTAAGLTGTPNLGFSGSGAGVGVASQGGPQIQGQGGGAAMMSFHRPGAYGINFGLNSDNVLCTGGWSRAGTHIVLDTGNIGTYAVPLSGATMSGSLTIRNGSPTLFLQDTDHISAMLHCNGNKVYILRGSGADSTTWTQVNGEWPVYWDLTNNAARFGGAVHAVGAFTTNAGFNSDSDERIKENWSDLSADFVEQLANVKCGTYDRIDINIGRRQVGVSAQSLQALMPEAVDYNEERDRLSVSYGNAALSSAVELAKRVVKQCKEIDDLKDRIVKLESLINKLIGD